VIRVVLALGLAQTLNWGASYYLPAVLAAPIARDLGLHVSTVFAVFSGALLLTALFGPAVGRAIDARGGRPVLLAAIFVLAAGLILLALAQGLAMLALAWGVLGLGMAMGLYDAAFATLAGLYGGAARNPITGITLIAGFASTLGWPLSALMLAEWGWRGACWGWAAVLLGIALPLVLSLPKAGPPPHAEPKPTSPPAGGTRRAALLLAFAFAVTGFVSTALGAHLPGLLLAAGAAPAAAIAASALLGPAQVGARLMEFGLLRRFHPLVSARAAHLAHPLGAAALLLVGAPAAAVFTVLHGAGNGMLTIARGTLPLAVFGPAGYGARQGLLTAPARIASALAPALFGLLVEAVGVHALWLTAALSLLAFSALLALRASPKASR
jgi:MFS family permease